LAAFGAAFSWRSISLLIGSLRFANPGATMTDPDPEKSDDGPFLTTREAARFLKLKPNTLEKMRVYGGGPIFRKHGRHVRYHIDDLNAWSDLRKKDSTADV